MSAINLNTIVDKKTGNSIEVGDIIKVVGVATIFQKTMVNEPAFRVESGVIVANGDLEVTVNSTVVSIADGASVTMPAMAAGTDYAIYATASGLVASNNFTNPSGFTADDSRRIGGFHYQDGVINDRSIWDLKFKPSAKDPRGMALVIGDSFWADIYLLNTTPDLLGTSAYNAQIADGSSCPKIPLAWGGNGTEQYSAFTQYIATEVLSAYGKRLPNQHEFSVLAKGSVPGHAAGVDPVKTKFDVSARSVVGCEQVSGHLWQWGSECWDRGDGSTGYGWQEVNTNEQGQVYASGANGVGASLFGALWDDAGFAGSCASTWDGGPWTSNSNISARGVCDHVILP